MTYDVSDVIIKKIAIPEERLGFKKDLVSRITGSAGRNEFVLSPP